MSSKKYTTAKLETLGMEGLSLLRHLKEARIKQASHELGSDPLPASPKHGGPHFSLSLTVLGASQKHRTPKEGFPGIPLF